MYMYLQWEWFITAFVTLELTYTLIYWTFFSILILISQLSEYTSQETKAGLWRDLTILYIILSWCHGGSHGHWSSKLISILFLLVVMQSWIPDGVVLVWLLHCSQGHRVLCLNLLIQLGLERQHGRVAGVPDLKSVGPRLKVPGLCYCMYSVNYTRLGPISIIIIANSWNESNNLISSWKHCTMWLDFFLKFCPYTRNFTCL